MMRTVRLNDGSDMPVLAFSADMSWRDPQRTKNATVAALAAGFKFFWNSINIGEASQRAMMQAVSASQIPRSELYIAGSISTLVPGAQCTNEAHCYAMARAQAALQVELLTLGGAPLDQLMVVDFPRTRDCALVRGPWRALEELKKAGKVKSLATANLAVGDLAGSDGWKLRCLASLTPPAVSQEPFCIGHAHDPGRQALARNGGGIWLQAYSPLGHGTLLSDSRLAAIARIHNVSTAAVALRWVTQRNATLITNSDKPQHLTADTAIFDFTLSAADLATLDAIRSSGMCGNWSAFDGAG